MIMWTTLMPWENREIDFSFQFKRNFFTLLVTFLIPFLKKIMAPLGPLNDLWVVVVTISEYGNGESVTPAETNPEMWAISTISKLQPYQQFVSFFCSQ